MQRALLREPAFQVLPTPPTTHAVCIPRHRPTPPTQQRSEDRGGTTIKHFCEMIHKSLLQELQYALVWGTSSKHMPQR